MKIKIIYFKNFFCKNMFKFITNIINKNSIILISGGNSIKKIVKNSKKKVFIDKFKTIILSDERIYSKINDLRTNYSNFKKNFFSFFKFPNFKFIYFTLGQNDKLLKKNFLKKVKNKIPKVAILSLGNDGHICSIFKNSKILSSNEYVDIVKPKNKIRRVTLNTKFLKKIKLIYLIVYGKKKGLALNKIMLGKKSMFPIMNYNKIIFILDKNAHQVIRNIKNKKHIKYFSYNFK